MTVPQLSVFAESKPGHLVRVLGVFGNAGVSVRGYSASDTGEYGIIRFIVDKPDLAYKALQDQNFACVLTQVLCVRLEDTPGELSRVMAVLAKCGINVIYSYSLISTYIVLSVSDIEEAEQLLLNEPVEMISQDELAHTVVCDAGKDGN